MGLIGRQGECARLDGLLAAVAHAGESRTLVVYGEAGVGKTALLDYLADQGRDCRVLRTVGVQSDMELAFATLHQVCVPLLDGLDVLPSPQRDALRVAFGLSAGPAPDGFLIALAVLGLLSNAAEQQPVLCLVDDVQWLDHASARVLAFVARRLEADSVGLVFGSRLVSEELAALPRLIVHGLREADARLLLDTVLTGPIDPRVRDQIVAETGGNPLALHELPRGLTAAQLAGGFNLPAVTPLVGSIQEAYERRVRALPDPSRTLLLLAAADPTGDSALVWRAAALLGIHASAVLPVANAQLAEFGTRVSFRHPLARSATYQSATAQERLAVHESLAEVTDPRLDPDRRAWHQAQACAGPDDAVAAELEQRAARAQARGGLSAAAAFLRQAAVLTLDAGERARRALDAAEAKLRAGAFDEARDLLVMAERESLSELRRARVDLMRAQLAFVADRGGDAPALLLAAAKRLESIDPDLARDTYLDALIAAIFAGPLAGAGGDVLDAARAAAAAPAPRRAPNVVDALLDGTAAGLHQGYAAGVPILRQALVDYGPDMSVEEELRWMWLACTTAMRIWDDALLDRLTTRYLTLARESGALSELPLALVARVYMLSFSGDLAAAAVLCDELQTVMDATGGSLVPYSPMGLAALRGDEPQATALIETALKEAAHRGEGTGVVFANCARATLNNGLGRYEEAMAAGLRATAYDRDLGELCWSLIELTEAAARCGATETAASAVGRLSEMADSSGTDWVCGVRARSQALLCQGEEAERLHQEAILHLGRTRMRVDLARAHLLYGEWLRRERRRIDAREQLGAAYEMFHAMGIEGFAERADRELQATGKTARKRAGSGVDGNELTAQETQIARLARDGLSNPEIGARLFISAHTVQYHLRKVFAKLGITSRSQLDRVLSDDHPVADKRH
ncbi:AAA family ATPase [Streptacidiphilus sp. EB129]|uniref:helix-turn-helix transcriptional regulator n=1 Tax=Streptacidiphilus sp. EB129 TaxID=3156262 RepID=UPI0035143014